MGKRQLKAASATERSQVLRAVVALAASFALGAALIVPYASATVIFLVRYNPLEFTENITGFALSNPVYYWPRLIALGHFPPIYFVAIAYVVFFTVFSLYLMSLPVRASSKKALFGPSAQKTHEKGSAQVETDEHVLMNNTRTWAAGRESFCGGSGGVAYGYSLRYGRYYFSSGDDHTIILGPPKSGKTRRVLLPSIRVMGQAGDSLVIVDPKGELFSKTHRFLEGRGYDVKIIDLRNSDRSNLWSPTSEIVDAYFDNMARAKEFTRLAQRAKAEGHLSSGTSEGFEEGTFEHFAYEAQSHINRAYEQAEDLSKDIAEVFVPLQVGSSPADFWNNSARGLICALILLVCTYDADSIRRHWETQLARVSAVEKTRIRDIIARLPARIEIEQRSLASVEEILNTQGAARTVLKNNMRVTEIDLEVLFEVLPTKHPAKAAYAQAKNAKDETLASMVVTAQEKLRDVLSRSFNAAAYASEFKMRDIADRQMAVFLIMPDERPAKAAPAVMFIALLYQALVKVALEQGGTLKRKVQVVCEELGNLPAPIPRFANMLAVSRQRNITFTLVLQDFEQLIGPYGREPTHEIKANCNTTVFLKTNSLDTAKEISDRLGKYTYREESTSSSKKLFSMFEGSAGESYRLQSREWLTPDEVLNWNPEFGNIVFRSGDDKRGGGLANLLYGRALTHPAVFPAPDISKTPTEGDLGLGSPEHDQALWAQDERIDRRASRKFVNPWRGHSSSVAYAESAFYEAGTLSPEVQTLMEELTSETEEEKPEEVDREREEKTDTEEREAGTRKMQPKDKKGYAELTRAIKREEEVMKAHVRRELALSSTLAREICLVAGVGYEEINVETVRQDYVRAQKKVIKQELLNDGAWRWKPPEPASPVRARTEPGASTKKALGDIEKKPPPPEDRDTESTGKPGIPVKRPQQADGLAVPEVERMFNLD